jgi:hypothetical protein
MTMSDFTKTKYSMTAETREFFQREEVLARVVAARAEFPSVRVALLHSLGQCVLFLLEDNRYVCSYFENPCADALKALRRGGNQPPADRDYWLEALREGRALADENGEPITSLEPEAGERFRVSGPFVSDGDRPVYRATDEAMAAFAKFPEWIADHVAGDLIATTGVSDCYVTAGLGFERALADGRAHPESAKRWLEREAGEGKVDPIQSLIAGASRVAAHLGEPITEMTLGGVKSPGLATIKPLPKPDPYAAHRENLAAAGIHSEEQIAWMTKSQPECQVKVAFTADTIPASREAGGVHPWDADDVEYES